MTMRLFIDECLSPELVEVAIAAGYPESTCSRNRGLQGFKDWRLMTVVVSGDYTFVTHNSRDFRGAGASAPGGLHARQDIHAGLICLNSYFPMDLERQHRLFELALSELGSMSDLTNQALEIFEYEDGTVIAQVYEIPGAS
ncbi:DUF5615 family PIN-like protein [Aquabacterium sp. A7-Y]|uniref:DUF5615 family PIN-like protein n=1 Tax=Aquabacterium sp. A7-Y TaxID=1349605 RepID=UPI00223CFE27|nr:DUF5615 family PIN-like protein [Aquabacterium sp. A7-Y]MCW7541851.1 DUF5615 family PIN-like protein [Aquabacterium sp. A7-Y]